MNLYPEAMEKVSSDYFFFFFFLRFYIWLLKSVTTSLSMILMLLQMVTLTSAVILKTMKVNNLQAFVVTGFIITFFSDAFPQCIMQKMIVKTKVHLALRASASTLQKFHNMW